MNVSVDFREYPSTSATVPTISSFVRPGTLMTCTTGTTTPTTAPTSTSHQSGTTHNKTLSTNQCKGARQCSAQIRKLYKAPRPPP